jgi:hypothetical protein
MRCWTSKLLDQLIKNLPSIFHSDAPPCNRTFGLIVTVVKGMKCRLDVQMGGISKKKEDFVVWWLREKVDFGLLLDFAHIKEKTNAEKGN